MRAVFRKNLSFQTACTFTDFIITALIFQLQTVQTDYVSEVGVHWKSRIIQGQKQIAPSPVANLAYRLIPR